MKTIKIRTDQLRNILVTNKAVHQKAYEKAIKGFWTAVQTDLAQFPKVNNKKELDILLDMLQEHGRNMPEDHTRDYDEALNMLVYHTEDTINLERKEFQNYVEDNWSWKTMFERSNQTYSNIR